MSEPPMAPANLVGGWDVPCSYFFLAIALGLGLRCIMSALRAFEKAHGTPYFSTAFALFCGRSVGRLVADYWHPFILGTLELLAYPVILKTGNINAVGAWLGLKTLAQWKEWSENRRHFNRFLIGNALVILLSVLFLGPLVTIKNNQ